MRDAGARAIGEDVERFLARTDIVPHVQCKALIGRLAASVRDLEAEAALWRKNLEDAQSDLAGEVEAHRLEREARVRLLAHVRDLERELAYWKAAEAAREEERRQADEARVRVEGERDDARSWGIAMMSEAHATYHQTAKDWLACPRPTCVEARAALAPPERSRVAAPPEPPGADDDPGGA